MKTLFRWLRRHRYDAKPDADAGVGQTLFEDIRFLHRFRRYRMSAVVWRRPSEDERREIDSHPQFGRFGDDTIAVADRDGRRLIVRERFWHGWPDPPRFVFFAVAGEIIWSAADFDGWPARWSALDDVSL
ncbi:hypothetical protein [Chitinasiproducens palmae]|uniref:Uncharacterized protein n=1 Tax=Chitinasiproducens palmae TaxID=1770053 RepID=A0A1H2PUT7_9BURK|nr:hypothetical protein [Chitinasiproducens palmae]SDV50615.1 hypothetical protein SAMN05216551_112130 [Chitinasiproducens palmae]